MWEMLYTLGGWLSGGVIQAAVMQGCRLSRFSRNAQMFTGRSDKPSENLLHYLTSNESARI